MFKAVCRTATDLTIRDIGSVIFLFGPENCEACKSRCKFRSDSFWGVSPSLHNYGRGDPGVYLQNCTVLQQQIKFSPQKQGMSELYVYTMRAFLPT